MRSIVGLFARPVSQFKHSFQLIQLRARQTRPGNHSHIDTDGDKSCQAKYPSHRISFSRSICETQAIWIDLFKTTTNHSVLTCYRYAIHCSVVYILHFIKSKKYFKSRWFLIRWSICSFPKSSIQWQRLARLQASPTVQWRCTPYYKINFISIQAFKMLKFHIYETEIIFRMLMSWR